MSDMKETTDQLAKTNSIPWYGHALRKDKKNHLRMAQDNEVKWTVKMARPQRTWLQTMVEQSRKAWLKENDANNQSKCRLGVNILFLAG